MFEQTEIHKWRTRLAETEARLADAQVARNEIEAENLELKKKVAELQKRTSAETLLRDLITENSPLPTFIMDAANNEFRYIYANPATCALFHLSRAQIIGHTDTELFGESVGSICHEHCEQALASQRIFTADEAFIDATGTPHRLTCIYGVCNEPDYSIYNDLPGRTLIVCFCLDQTSDEQNRQQIKELNRSQEQLIARLRSERDRAIAAEQARSFFFSTVSHDIRTPLNAIIGFSEMLKLGTHDEEERKRFLDSILLSGKTLLQLINDVLDLSKLEAGKMEIHPEPTDCVKLINEIVESFRASSTNPAIEIFSKFTTPIPFLIVDPQRIRQILFNLVGNAVKFTTQGHVKIIADYDPPTSTFTMCVEDTGCGIPEEDQARIASPYVQSSMGHNRGTGLGLAICKELVNCMGGKMKFASTVGKGTIFQIEICNVQVAKEETLKALSATQLIRLAVSVPVPATKCVLIVDDSAVNLAVLKAMLRRMGIKNVITANNGREALEIMGGHPIDMVLTDMWMPEMDGRTLVRTLRADPRFAKLPIYAVTADVETRKTCAEVGFTGILLKPLTLEKLSTLFSGSPSID